MIPITQQQHAIRRAVRFEFQAPANAKRVALVGDFNNWSRYRHLMQRSPSGVWEITVTLAPDRYQYKFLVNDLQWFTDPKAHASVQNSFGTHNSVVEVK
jgi:1,4-alpha-glucan branching enzyme